MNEAAKSLLEAPFSPESADEGALSERRPMRTRTRTSLRAIAIVLHRYVGLAITLFLFVAGLTGSLLAFYEELEGALNPTLFSVSSPDSNATPLDPLEVRDRLQEQLPAGAHANFTPLETEPGKTLAFFVESPSESGRSTDNQYFVDPYSGKVVGSRRWGDVTQGWKNVMPFIYRLHYSLALGDVGIVVFGVAALLWTLDCFVGAYLTVPPRRQGARAIPVRSWLRRWKSSWILKTTKLFSFVFTWHRASGLWIWGMLLVFAWSAVGLNLHTVYNPVMKTIFGMQERAYDRLPEKPSNSASPSLSWIEARSIGRRLMAEESRSRGFDVHEELHLDYVEKFGAFRYRVRSSLDVSERYANTTIWFDDPSRRMLAFEAPTGGKWGNTITSILNHLHFGTISGGGLPYRIFVAILGTMVALLSISGVWIWLRKRRKQHVARSKASQSVLPRTNQVESAFQHRGATTG